MHGLGLFLALMESLGGSSPAPKHDGTGTDPVEPLDDANYDAWAAWARGERSRWASPAGAGVRGQYERPAAPVGLPPERGVLGRI